VIPYGSEWGHDKVAIRKSGIPEVVPIFGKGESVPSCCIEKSSICGGALVSWHDVHKQQVEITSRQDILRDIPMTVPVAHDIVGSCKRINVHAINAPAAIPKEGEIRGIVGYLWRSRVRRVLDVFVVESACNNIENSERVFADGVPRPLKPFHQFPLATSVHKPVNKYCCLFLRSDVPTISQPSVHRHLPAQQQEGGRVHPQLIKAALGMAVYQFINPVLSCEDGGMTRNGNRALQM
jgi:hypothetical protein